MERRHKHLYTSMGIFRVSPVSPPLQLRPHPHVGRRYPVVVSVRVASSALFTVQSFPGKVNSGGYAISQVVRPAVGGASTPQRVANA